MEDMLQDGNAHTHTHTPQPTVVLIHYHACIHTAWPTTGVQTWVNWGTSSFEIPFCNAPFPRWSRHIGIDGGVGHVCKVHGEYVGARQRIGRYWVI